MNENRILVKVAKIDGIESLTVKNGEPARSELVHVGGWKATVGKGDFKVGDLVVFAEIDSVFPQDERWAFLEKRHWKITAQKYGNLLRTVGDGVTEPTISDGLVLPLSVLGEGNWELGQDVTKILGVTHAPENDEDEFADNAEFTTKAKPMLKWLPGYNKLMRFAWFRNLSLPKREKGGFVKEVSKTDEERIQNCENIVNADTLWTLTEKVDGSSSTYRLKKTHATWFARKFKGAKKFDFAVCSRNNRLAKPDNSAFWAMAKKYNVEKMLRNIIGDNEWVCVQGETIGPKMNNNRLKLKENKLLIFNVIFPNGRMKSVDAKKLMEENNMEFVPILESGVSLKGKTADDLLKLANGNSMVNSSVQREGIVFRAENPKMDLSFKAVSPEYLLKIKG